MDKFVIEGGARLSGSVRISGAKNASLALIPTVLLAPGVYRLANTPNIRDVWTISRLLGSMGVHCELNGEELLLDSRGVNSHEAPYEFVKQMRASINVLGPLVARYGRAKVSLPGGCAFGPRPVDLHLKGLEKLGADIQIDAGYIIAKAESADGRLVGANIHFDTSSVGATENILSAAVLAKGTSVLSNCAVEPEVTALAKLLQKMGAKIDGVGTTTLTVDGVDALQATDFENIPDRIEAATFMIAAAMTNGKVTLKNVNPYHLTAVIAKMEEAGCSIDVAGSEITVSLDGPPKPTDITTTQYPGFPTDTQAQWISFMLMAQGEVGRASRVTDTIYPTRFHHVPELTRMGAVIEMAENTAIVMGGHQLSGASVMSSDLRASACLVLAGLVARGQTELLRVYHLDRGYQSLETKLCALGANVLRVKTEEY